MKECADLVKDIGFPVFVTLYLLWERRTGYHELKRVILELRDAVHDLAGKVHL